YYGSGGKKIIAKTLQDILLVHEIDAANEHIKPMDTLEYIASQVSMRLVREDLESPVETEEDCDCTISLA
ncbi:hypothetical protein BDB00DRAFT_806353, partial [Zychaea mexicana]|uniref:uncharacterized protein n=1 Tax=Zychaea mexicana TaxID=64656 RepID=UPI0022FF111C